MADKKNFFASLRYIVPEDLEYFLEERASEGFKLERLRESSLFYFDFTEGTPEICGGCNRTFQSTLHADAHRQGMGVYGQGHELLSLA